MADAEDAPECPICLEVLTPADTLTTACSHSYHHSCYLEMLRVSPTLSGCALCRRHVVECIPLAGASLPVKHACLWLVGLGLAQSNYIRMVKILPQAGHKYLAGALLEHFRDTASFNTHEACRDYLLVTLKRAQFYTDYDS